MKVMKATFLAATLAAASLTLGGTANAAPVGAIGKAVSTDQAGVQQVKHRRYKHRHYRKYRHRGYGYYRGYRPGFSLYIGPRWGHRHHHRHRHWRHRH